MLFKGDQAQNMRDAVFHPKHYRDLSGLKAIPVSYKFQALIYAH
jgi:hypothetical protein